MEPLTIANFKYGLDTRREELASQLGTLYRFVNGHVNPGGEVEKRKAFIDFADVSVLDTDGNQGTFGLEATELGLLVFGSALNYGVTPVQQQPTLASALSSVTYRQLQHPTVADGEDYDADYHLMEAVVFSRNFNGKDFVAARFTDGRVFWYYNGTLVQQSRNGLVLEGEEDVAFQAEDLAREINALGWTATPNVAPDGTTPQNGSVLVVAPGRESFVFSQDVQTASDGDILSSYVNGITLAEDGVKASTSFLLTVTGAGTIWVRAPQASGAQSPTVDLTGGTIAAEATAALTVTKVVAAINNRIDFTGGYTAAADGLGTSVIVYAPMSFGVFTLNLEVECDGLVSAGSGSTLTTEFDVPNPGETLAWYHNLGYTPKFYRVALVAINTPTADYSIGDEINALEVWQGNTLGLANFSTRADDQYIYLERVNLYNDVWVMSKTGGSFPEQIDLSYWKVKFYV